MGDIPFNSPKAIYTANQLRTKMGQKLCKMLGEKTIVGPLDPYILRAYEAGCFDEATKDELLRVSVYCDNVLFTSNFTDIPDFKVLVGWSEMIDRL